MFQRSRRARRVFGTLIAASLVVAACGGDDDAAGDTTIEVDGTAAAATTPENTTAEDTTPEGTTTESTGDDGSVSQDDGSVDPAGTLNVAYAGPSDSLDPHRAVTPVVATYIYPIYDRLFFIDRDRSVQPMLATEYSFADDGSTMDLTLRDDVKFHDGSPVDAEAVKASIERAQTLPDSSVAGLLKGITGIEVIDATHVQFTLDGAGPELPAVLGTTAGSIMNPAVLEDPSVDLDSAPPEGAGSGPYVVVESEPNVKTSYVAAPEYWNPDVGQLAELSVTFVAQAPSRVAGLQAGDFDLVQITGDVFDQATSEADAGVYELVTTPAATRDIFLNTESGDLADPDVRRAINLAINPDEVAAVAPCVAHGQPQFEGHWAFDPSISNDFDPDEAKALIDARGGAAFETLVASGSSYEPVATVVQGQLAAVGIDMTILPVEQAQTTPQFNNGEAQSIFSSLTPGVDPVQTLNNYILGGASLAKGDAATEIQALADQAADVALSQDERAEIYFQIWNQVIDENMYVPICRGLQGWAFNKPIIGVADMPGIDGGLPDLTLLAISAE